MNTVKRTIKQTERCSLSIWTTSWDLSWAFLSQESCLVPGRVSLLCSLPLAPLVLTYLHFSRLQTCHTYPHKWCPEGPCSLQTGSGCLCPFLLVGLLFTDILPWTRQAWMMETECVLEMELQGFRIQPSTEEGGRSFLFSKDINGYYAKPLWHVFVLTISVPWTAINQLIADICADRFTLSDFFLGAAFGSLRTGQDIVLDVLSWLKTGCFQFVQCI